MLRSFGPNMDGRWAWRAIGGQTSLVADHGPRNIILTDALTRDPETGFLEPADPKYVAMQAIEAVPEMRVALEAIFKHTSWRDDEVSRYVAAMAKAALERGGEQP